METMLGRRSGTVTCHRSRERWTAEIGLEEGSDERSHRHSIWLHREFPTQDVARRAGERIVADWNEGHVPLRELLLRELAAVYRALRETHRMMQPVTVPATRATWERALAIWARLGWIDAADAARYAEHVRYAFEPEAQFPPRRGLDIDPTDLNRADDPLMMLR
jgi:hypothetical protein